LPTWKSARSDAAADAVLVTLTFTAVNVTPDAFQVCVRLSTGLLVVSVAPPMLRASFVASYVMPASPANEPDALYWTCVVDPPGLPPGVYQVAVVTPPDGADHASAWPAVG